MATFANPTGYDPGLPRRVAPTEGEHRATIGTHELGMPARLRDIPG